MKDALKKIAAETGADLRELESMFESMSISGKIYANQSPIQSAGGKPSPEEGALFAIIEEAGYKPKNKFTMESLMNLFTKVEAMYSKFFPLRDGTTGRIITPSIHMVPSIFPHPKWMDTVETAAASGEGDIVFNKNFAETLMAYADLFDIKGEAAFYESNGGTIPDNYVYIEFLIQHEIGHILRGDAGLYIDALAEDIESNKAKYKNVLKQFGGNARAAAGRINNIAADLIMNHSIVKSGLPMLPIGLLSSEINYDKIKNISEMWDIIIKEMEENFDEEAFDKQQQMMDDHQLQGEPLQGGGQGQPQQSDGQDGEDQEGEDDNTGGTPSGQGSEDDKDQDGKNKNTGGTHSGNKSNKSGDSQDSQDGDTQDGKDGDDKDGDGQDGEDGEGQDGEDGEGQDGEDGEGEDGENSDNQDAENGKGGSDATDAIKKAEEAFRDSQNKIKEANSNRDKSEEELKKMAKEAEEELNKQTKEELKKKIEALMNRGRMSDGNATIGAKDYEPRYNWKRIVKRMMPTNETKDTSYSKINRRNAAGLLQMKQHGISAAKAGEIIEKGNKKDVVFVLDRSGSVSSVLSKVKKEMKKLIDNHSDSIDNFYVIKFDSYFDVYRVSDDRKTFTRYKTKEYLDGKNKPSGSTYPIHKLFVEEIGGGTEFHKEIIKFVDNILSNGGSGIMFTDSDILYDKNKKNISKLIRSYGKVPFKFNIVLASKDDFTAFLKEVTAYTYLTYFNLD